MNSILPLSQPWAISAAQFQAMAALRPSDLEAVRTLGQQPARTRSEVRGSVAVVDVAGILARNPHPILELFGWASMDRIGGALQAALADDAVGAIILNVDSPGGTVDGTQSLAAQVHAARGRKPVVAYTDAAMASAAYWIGSAAGEIYIGADTAQVGSIGVVAKHVDVSGAEDRLGIRTTEIVSGRYKRIASRHGALSEEGRQSMQEQVDYLYGVFVDDVARYRGVAADSVLADMADGRVFIGRQAIEAGLVDGRASLDELAAELSSRRRR